MALLLAAGVLSLSGLESNAAAGPRSLLPAASGSIRCNALRGSISFSPALTAKAKAEKVTIALGSTDCVPSDPSTLTSESSFSNSLTLQGLSCTSLKHVSAAISLAAAWTPSLVSPTALTFSGFDTAKTAAGGTAFQFPAKGGAAAANGSYQGSNGGALSSLDAESAQSIGALTTACKKMGLRSIPIVNGGFSAGGDPPAFTGPALATFTEGTYGTFAIPTNVTLPAKITWTGSLPEGLTLVPDPGGDSATLAGTPVGGNAADNAVILAVLDQYGHSGSLPLTIHVDPIDPTRPVIISVANNDGTSGNSAAPGQVVTISGHNLSDVTSVSVGGVDAPIKTASSSTLAVTVPDVARGPQDVSVTSPEGTSPPTPDDLLDVQSVPRQPVPPTVWSEGRGVHVEWAPAPTGDEVTSYTVVVAPPSDYAGKPGDPCTNPVVMSAIPATATYADVAVGNCAGVPFVATLSATNASGAGVASDPSSVTTGEGATVPAGPVVTHVTPSSHALTVFWSPPTWSGGVPLDGYVVTLTCATKIVRQVAATAVQVTVTGLTNGQSCDVSVVASNAIGGSQAGTGAGTPNKSVPDAPSWLEVVPTGNGNTLRVDWNRPRFSVDPITGYQVTLTPVAPPGVACRALTTAPLAEGWSPPVSLKVTVPSCAPGFSTVTIGGRSYTASADSPVPGQIVLTGAAADGSVLPAIPAGAAVNFDTNNAVGKSKDYVLKGSKISANFPKLPGSSFYDVSVAAVNAAGVGTPVDTQVSISPTVVLAPRTTVLDATALNTLTTQIDGGTSVQLIWHTPPSQSAGIQSGDCIVVGQTVPGAPGRILLVQWAGFNHSGDYVIVGTSAGLDDAYRNFGYSVAGTPPVIGGGPTAAHRHGAPKPTTINVNQSWNGFAVSGTITASPSVSASASLSCSLRHGCSASAQASAGIYASENLTVTLSGSHSFDLLTVNLPEIWFTVGIVPVELSPSIHFTLDVSGSVTASTSGSLSLSGWIAWSNSNGFSSGSSHSVSGSIPTSGITGTANADLGVAFQICAYGNVLCGHVGAHGTLDASFNGAAISPAKDVTLTCGAYLEVGMGLNIFTWHPSSSATLVSTSSVCWTHTAPAGVKVLTITPVSFGGFPANTVPVGANVVTLTATRNDAVTPTLQWVLLNPVAGPGCADAINGSGSLSPGCLGGGRYLTIRATDTSVVPNLVAYKTVQIIVAPIVAPPPPSAFTSGFIGWRTAHLFLSPPSWTGGYPMSGYNVTFGCPVLANGYGPQTIWVPYAGNPTLTTVLTPGITVCPVSVQARNTNGAWSPVVTTWLVI